MGLTQKKCFTESSIKIFLFTFIFLNLGFSNFSIAQFDNNKFNSSDFIINNSNDPISYIKNNNLIASNKIIDFTEDVIAKKDELNHNANKINSVHGIFVPITGNVRELDKFFRALKGYRTNKIRIAHYGDSILLGDVITENLRQNFQEKFGGDGIGFLSIVPDDIKMKRSITQTVYGNWNVGSITKGNPKHYPIGISGLTAQATRNSKVKFETTSYLRTSRSFKTARIFYSNANASSSISYSFSGGKYISKKLSYGNNIQELIINSSKLETTLEIDFSKAAGTYFYGVSLETDNGIYVDNFPMTGNSGVSLNQIELNTLQAFDKYMNYKLIIIQFGVNATQLTMNFAWYKNKMIRVIEHYKSAFPDASILLVSAGDLSIKRGSNFVSDPQVQKLIATQKKIIAKTNVAFWNLFEAMGGKNSNKKWVNASPPLGLRDYIHFTNLGGKVVADLLFQALMKEYK